MELFSDGRSWYLFPPNDSPRSARTVRDLARADMLQTAAAGIQRGALPALALPSPRRVNQRPAALPGHRPRRAAEAEGSSGQQLSRQHLLYQMHLNHGLSDEQIMGQLRKVKWFRTLSLPQTQVLYRRAQHMFFQRYSTIIREGNLGSNFYVLLQGRVHCTSSVKGKVDVVLGPGNSFGEGALVTQVRREAQVVALEDCYLLQFTAADVDGLPVELQEVRIHVISLILQKVHFFEHSTDQQRERLAMISQLQYFQTGEEVFAEGDLGDRLYIIVAGRVSMLKKSEAAKADEASTDKGEVVATYSTEDELPWFGELAIMGAKPRACTARCDEPTKVLIVHADQFPQFVEVVPMFQDMFSASASSYNAINALLRQKESLGNAISASLEGVLSGGFSPVMAALEPSAAPLSVPESNWERLVKVLLRREAASEAAAEEEPESPAGGASKSPRRSSKATNAKPKRRGSGGSVAATPAASPRPGGGGRSHR